MEISLIWPIKNTANRLFVYVCFILQRTREMVEKGYRMPMPHGTPLKVYDIMNRCWEYDASHRPNFSEIEREMEAVSK